MGGIYVYVLIFSAAAALFSLPLFWLWAWALGPAVKHLGQKWEEGKQQAKKSASEEIQAAYLRGINHALEGKIYLGPVTPPPDARLTAGPPGPPRRHTITGRELP